MYLFLRAKKKVFPEYLFFANGKFRKFRVYKFQPHRINDKKKTVELEDGYAANFCQDHDFCHDGKAVAIYSKKS